jgi:hypothetical protein
VIYKNSFSIEELFVTAATQPKSLTKTTSSHKSVSILPNLHGVREELKKPPKASHLERITLRIAGLETSEVVHNTFSPPVFVSPN